MVEYLNNNIYSFWFTVGFILLAIEALAFGFTTGFVLFVGLAALMTGGLIWFDLVPATWIASMAAFAVSSVLISAVLWKPLKSIQRHSTSPDKDNSSDLIGLTFRLNEDISITSPGATRYSGIEWQVEIAHDAQTESISKGAAVVVVSVSAGKFWVAMANKAAE